MRRAAALAAVAAAAALPAWLFATEDRLPARFAPGDCRRVAIVDARTGWRVSGAEDLALTPDGATVIASAHDRRDTAWPDGGLYAVAVRDLASAGSTEAVQARPLVDPAARKMPFRPHGMALSPDGRRLALVNRVAPRESVVEIGRLDGSDWHCEAIIRDGRLCRANDLAFEGDGDTLVVTIDRADCTTSFRDIRPGARTGSIGRIEGGALHPLRTGLRFPNGIVAGAAGQTVAETRGRRLLRPDGRVVPLPGAPDNLTVDRSTGGTTDNGALIVAVHPGLLRLWFFSKGWVGRAPSRILRVAADDSIETLFDDPSGALFSGATTGVMAGGGLIAGSAHDTGLLVCGEPGGHPA